MHETPLNNFFYSSFKRAIVETLLFIHKCNTFFYITPIKKCLRVASWHSAFFNSCNHKKSDQLKNKLKKVNGGSCSNLPDNKHAPLIMLDVTNNIKLHRYSTL